MYYQSNILIESIEKFISNQIPTPGNYVRGGSEVIRYDKKSNRCSLKLEMAKVECERDFCSVNIKFGRKLAQYLGFENDKTYDIYGTGIMELCTPRR